MAAFAAILAAATTTIAVGEYYSNYLFRTPSRFGDYERSRIINGIIRAGDNECVAQLRMNKATFFNLCSFLNDRNLFLDGKHVCMEEQLVMFLHKVGNNVRNRVIRHRFIRSGETVSRYFSKALDAIVGLYPEFVKLPRAETPIEILVNPNWSMYFHDCIGAIDGTHVPTYVPALEGATHLNKKGVLSQNVMAACTFDLMFVYVLARWEGSASDTRVLYNALTYSTDRFTIPEGKCYVVDAGYASPGFMAPYRAIFGVLKARFPILKSAPPYNLLTQVKIVIACCVLHNFIRLFRGDSLIEDEVTSTDVMESIDLSPYEVNVTQREKDEWATFRDNIASRMWNESHLVSHSV
ncbi:uncharacterized protein LOC131218139 [Magnolia sinica]|uniref:uncharacterized protein LOC131218139 n=1 Tax=Magnolia sinica TaxID=86752 RepID=UPI002657EE34|nr:uncharacterized protein LOC131218139 [Magnolia sinica]